MSDVICVRCAASISADAINLQAMVAKCNACNAVFRIADQIPAIGRSTPERLDVPIPERFQVEQAPEGLQITWRWYTPMAWFLVFFSLLWNGIMVVWFVMTVTAGAGAFALFGSAHLLIGLGMAYTTLSLFINRTTIGVELGVLRVRHGPLPMFGARTFAPAGIRQIYCVERIRRTRHAAVATYDVQAVRADGVAVNLLRELPDSAQALYLEQQLERALGIQDTAVAGEVAR